MRGIRKKIRQSIYLRNAFAVIGFIGTVILAGKSDFETLMGMKNVMNPYAVAVTCIGFAGAFIFDVRAKILDARYINLMNAKEMRSRAGNS